MWYKLRPFLRCHFDIFEIGHFYPRWIILYSKYNEKCVTNSFYEHFKSKNSVVWRFFDIISDFFVDYIFSFLVNTWNLYAMLTTLFPIIISTLKKLENRSPYFFYKIKKRRKNSKTVRNYASYRRVSFPFYLLLYCIVE